VSPHWKAEETGVMSTSDGSTDGGIGSGRQAITHSDWLPLALLFHPGPQPIGWCYPHSE
jgi:hypothetical protein